MKNLQTSRCLASECHLKEKCDRFTKPKTPFGDAYQNFSPFKKGEFKGQCMHFVSNEDK